MPRWSERSLAGIQRLNTARGFTLIELAVVMFLLVIIIGLTGVRVSRDRSDIVRDEARRLALVLQNAQQQAILEGRLYAFTLTPDGYVFLQAGADRKLVPLSPADPLGPHALPYPVTVDLLKPESDSDLRGLVLFDPSGDFTVFGFVFRLDDIAWYVQGYSDGQIRSSPSLDAPAA